MNRLKAYAPKLVLIFRYVLLVAVIGFAAYYLASQWADVSVAIRTISPISLVLSFVLVFLGLAAGTMSWVAVLNGLGPKVAVPRGAQIMLVGQLGKYVPGSVWSYVMQMELGRQYQIPRPRILVTGLYAAGIGVVSSLILGGLALPTVTQDYPDLLWLFLLLPIGLACLHPRVMTWLASLVLKIFKRPPLDHRISFRVVGASVGWSLLSYVCYGIHLWLLVNSLVDTDWMTVVLMTGAISLGFTVGLFAFIFPSGVGVREAILIGVMTLVMTVAQASAVSLVSRLMFTLADVVAAGLAVLLVLVVRRRLAPKPLDDADAEQTSVSETAPDA